MINTLTPIMMTIVSLTCCLLWMLVGVGYMFLYVCIFSKEENLATEEARLISEEDNG